MHTERRGRGRPRGEGKKDSEYLAKVADLMVKNPSLRPTTAMKQIVHQRNDWGCLDDSVLRRFQVKWRQSGEIQMAAAVRRQRASAPVQGRDINTPTLKQWADALKRLDEGLKHFPDTPIAKWISAAGGDQRPQRQ